MAHPFKGNAYDNRHRTNASISTTPLSAKYAGRAALQSVSIANRILGAIPRLPLSNIDWGIVGGESGPGARAMDESWVVQIRDRCNERGVAFFFKQWGGVNKKQTGRELEGRTRDEIPHRTLKACNTIAPGLAKAAHAAVA